MCTVFYFVRDLLLVYKIEVQCTISNLHWIGRSTGTAQVLIRHAELETLTLFGLIVKDGCYKTSHHGGILHTICGNWYLVSADNREC